MEDKEINIYLSITNSLLKTTIEAFNHENFSYYSHVYIEINKIIDKIKNTKYEHYYDLPKLAYKSYPDGSDLMDVVSVLREINALLIAASGLDVMDNDLLKKEIEEKNTKVSQLLDKEKDYIEIIKQSRAISKYPVDENKFIKFSGNNLKLINEALNAYSVGAYTACICVCRNILQDLIQTLCKENIISEGGLESQIKHLLEKGAIKEKHHSQMIDLAKFFGHRAAHPTTEVFNQEKANLVLSSIFIINEEMF